ncbi:HAD family phosphatase [Marinilabilia sp.]|uniref:HAD family hydrolase n=1 Tax=Marinilabilia sp. TaxID=2021252 RepID=UPI0025C22DE3|nr:HAD family phosphatase [Marinilabilia sp.]
MAIKNIIFDLGNVLIPLEKEAAKAAFNELLAEDQKHTDIFSFKTLDAFIDYEIGKISSEQFLESIRIFFRPDVLNSEIVNAWNKIIGDFPVENVAMLKNLGQQYRLFVLSNTNEIHANKYEKEVPGVEHLGDLFEKLYYSHIMGLRKPQPEIYEQVLIENLLNPAETLFADDLAENIESAGKLGVQTLHVTPGLDLPGWFSGFNRK